MNLNDFVKGLDFSALSSATGSDHNNLIDQATPNTDRGFIIYTTDTAANTPDVPDPTASAPYNKAKRYLWLRASHSSVTPKTVTPYAWHDNATSVVTYLKWLNVSYDDTDVLADIAALQVSVAAAAATANSASSTASAAGTLANTANTTANAAQSTAVSAAADATTALSNANAAQTDADAAQATADSALANAAAAQATANTANTNANKVADAKFYTSSLQAWGSVSVAHGLSAVPKFVRWVAVCVSADLNYSVNDEISLSQVEENSGNFPSFSFGANATNAFAVISTAATARILNKTTGAFSALDTTKWNIKVYAWV